MFTCLINVDTGTILFQSVCLLCDSPVPDAGLSRLRHEISGSANAKTKPGEAALNERKRKNGRGSPCEHMREHSLDNNIFVLCDGITAESRSLEKKNKRPH